MQIIVNGLLTKYQLGGTGKVVVLLHGWGDSSIGLKTLHLELSKKYQVVTLDLPGFGGTQAPLAVWGLNDYAEFVSAFLTKLSLHAYTIIGHSNGGAIAVRGLSNGSLQAKKLVLLASAGVRSEQSARKLGLKLTAKTGKLLTAPLPAATRSRLRARFYEQAGSDYLVAEHLQNTFKQVVGEDIQTDATRLVIPTLLIYGADDAATPVRHGQLLQKAIPGAKLEILPATGHFVHLEQPAVVTNEILEFLK